MFWNRSQAAQRGALGFGGRGIAPMTPAPTFAFGEYVFVPRRQLLLRNGEPVRVGSRALDLLNAFVQRPGDVLSKRELLDEAWPSTTVVEGNLKVHIAALRRTLNDEPDAARYIATINGRGYRFIAPVRVAEAPALFRSLTPVQPGDGERQDAVPGAGEGGLQDVVALLTQAMRAVVVDLPGGTEAGPALPRRVLFIELTARDEAWIAGVLAQRTGGASATE